MIEGTRGNWEVRALRTDSKINAFQAIQGNGCLSRNVRK